MPDLTPERIMLEERLRDLNEDEPLPEGIAHELTQTGYVGIGISIMGLPVEVQVPLVIVAEERKGKMICRPRDIAKALEMAFEQALEQLVRNWATVVQDGEWDGLASALDLGSGVVYEVKLEEDNGSQNNLQSTEGGPEEDRPDHEVGL